MTMVDLTFFCRVLYNLTLIIFFFKQKTAYEIGVRLVGSAMSVSEIINAGLLARVDGELVSTPDAAL